MKKIILFFFISFAANVFSQEFGKPFDISFNVLKSGLYGNESKIQEQVPFLTELEKDMLFNAYKMDSGFSLYLNGGYGFGKGFDIMGDEDTAKTFRILDTVSLTCFFIFGGFSTLNLPFLPLILLGGTTDLYMRFLLASSITGATSVLVLLTSQTYQFTKLSMYSSGFNKDLKRVLGLSDLAFTVMPSIDITNGTHAIVASVKMNM